MKIKLINYIGSSIQPHQIRWFIPVVLNMWFFCLWNSSLDMQIKFSSNSTKLTTCTCDWRTAHEWQYILKHSRPNSSLRCKWANWRCGPIWTAIHTFSDVQPVIGYAKSSTPHTQKKPCDGFDIPNWNTAMNPRWCSPFRITTEARSRRQDAATPAGSSGYL